MDIVLWLLDYREFQFPIDVRDKTATWASVYCLELSFPIVQIFRENSNLKPLQGNQTLNIPLKYKYEN